MNEQVTPEQREERIAELRARRRARMRTLAIRSGVTLGVLLLLALFAAPWSALRMSRALQRKMPDPLAAVAGIGAALLAVLTGLTLATGVLLGVLAG